MENKDIKISRMESGSDQLVIFEYVGDGDPVKHLDDAITNYTKGIEYRDFIDASMDNPWTRIIRMAKSIDAVKVVSKILSDELSKAVKKNWQEDPREWAYEWLCGELGWSAESISLNIGTFQKALDILLPGKKVHIVKSPTFRIEVETGTILEEEEKVQNHKFMIVETYNINSIEDWDQYIANKPGKHVYVYEIQQDQMVCAPELCKARPTGFRIRMCEHYIPVKKTVSFTIDEHVYTKFLSISDRLAVNKSKYVENRIREFVEKNEMPGAIYPPNS